MQGMIGEVWIQTHIATAFQYNTLCVITYQMTPLLLEMSILHIRAGCEIWLPSYGSKHRSKCLSNKPFVHTYMYIVKTTGHIWTLCTLNNCSTIGDISCEVDGCLESMRLIAIYNDQTAFGDHVKVYSSVLAVINRYIENNRQKHTLVARHFGRLGWVHALKEGRPNRPKCRVTNVCFCLLFPIHLFMTTKTEQWTLTWPLKAVRLLYVEIILQVRTYIAIWCATTHNNKTYVLYDCIPHTKWRLHCQWCIV